jgi:hypothetical protein
MEQATPNAAPTMVSNATPELASAPIAPNAVVAPIVDMPMMADGGSVNQGGVKGFFGSINWLEAGFAILGVASLSYVIYYYRFKLKQDKMINNELQRQIDEVKMNVQGSMKSAYKSI